ncbi:YkvA family protein [Clostridium algidicarnis]|uniref:DUF1232 domain-containing protein n=1 Tax=Clostridium algidicarnis TaxID=37659 RepID=A0ABS6C128_9CLOT|nr:DUF1232 domain-containing protein [Clostridium algidicarnis]MBB6631994.1 DUF1232 domain-containing protein [Clostridium algidicarnis]MBB6697336.1 DUF1232 domain-containing protein [Clostridium algidicarnis]MBU3194601.1 DUF1232 domain-containing protein [Clostridium algidicarnis]MBU3206924.1 DUF1232 domain-containing protein [Clostridium algidicarnis]MBU3219142.1 DUF1232 domain-containing protein [Clostridium algidicarnis]
MLVSNVKVKLSEEDLIGIIDEYLNVEGLKIKSILINEFIQVIGSYKKVIDIPFKLTLAFGSFYNNEINLKLTSLKVYKIGVISPLKKYTLKKVIEDLKQKGVYVKEDNVTLDLNILLKAVPYVTFKLDYIELLKSYVEVSVSTLEISLNKSVESLKIEDVKEDIIYDDIENLEKVKDCYSITREKVTQNLPERYKETIEWAMIIPDILSLIYRIFKDKRVKTKTKIALGTSITYLALPFDIIPDRIPFIGKIDEFAVAFFAINRIVNDVPLPIILENWEGKNNIIVVLKEAITYINKFSGGTNVDKLYNVILKFS